MLDGPLPISPVPQVNTTTTSTLQNAHRSVLAVTDSYASSLEPSGEDFQRWLNEPADAAIDKYEPSDAQPSLDKIQTALDDQYLLTLKGK